MEAPPVRVTRAGRSSALRWRIALWVALAFVLLVASRAVDAPALLRSALEWITGLGAWGLIVFVVLYVTAAVLLLPAFVLTLGAGAVFGLARGFVAVWVGATLGALAAFLIGRYLARGWVARRIEDNPRFMAIDEAVAREGWKIVGLTRMSPAFPYVVLNYAFGVTRVSVRDFVLATAAGMIPGIAMYVYIGSLAGTLAGVGERARTPVEWTLYGVGLLATVAVTVYVTRVARAALDKRIARP
jgi:uncharacterized membrane protein YdjX (TVP38/TMEM64 family)